MLLQVTCAAGTKFPRDELQAWIPCRYQGLQDLDRNARPYAWPTGDFDSMDMGWIASALEAIYLARNKGLQSTGPPRIRFCGKIVADDARGDELLRHYQGVEPTMDTYFERIDLLLSVGEEQAGEATVLAVEQVVGHILHDVAHAF